MYIKTRKKMILRMKPSVVGTMIIIIFNWNNLNNKIKMIIIPNYLLFIFIIFMI